MTGASSLLTNPSRVSLWRQRGFMLFWSGETVSMFGSQVTVLALPLTAVLTLHATAAQLGWVRFLAAVPYILFALLFGAWVDRHRRRPVLILANAARGVLLALVPLLAAFHALSLIWLAVIAFGAGSFTVLFEVTWLAYIPTLVPSADLVAANGRMATSSSSAEVAGPGLAGVLVQFFSAPFALLADAVSYVVAMLTLLGLRVPEPAPPSDSARRSLRREISMGLRIVISDGYLRAIAFMSGLWNFLFSIADTVFLLYAITTLGLRPGVIGIIVAFGSIGGLLGAAISTTLARRSRFGPLLGIAFVLGSVPWVVLPMVRGAPLTEAVAFALAFFIIRTGLGIWLVLVMSLRQAITPGHLMGRTSASIRMISFGLGALGNLAAGFVGTALGLRPTLWLAAGGFLIILAITLGLTPLPRLRTLPPMIDPSVNAEM